MQLRLPVLSAWLWLLLFSTPSSGLAATASAGSQHTVVVKSDGTVWSWGGNGNGQLGDGSTATRKVPTQVPGLIGVVAVAAGGFHTLALTSGGAVWAWGANGEGQLGDGSTTQRLSPISIGLTSIVAIAAGDGHSVALGSDGAIWIWGRNSSGQLGDSTTTRRLVPQLVSGLSASAIGAGYSHTLAVKTDGSVWSWGGNQCGQLGDGTRTQRTAPVQVNGVSGATAVAAGHVHSLILVSGGSIYATGDNTYGQLGDSTWGVQRLSPVLVSGLSSATAVTVNYYQSGAILADGTARTWGYNGSGALGDGTTTNRVTAVQPIGLSGLAAFSFGYFNGVAVTTSGVVFTWGGNSSAQLGDGTTTGRTVPEAISEAGFNWLVSTPAFSVAGGTYYAPQTVLVTNATTDASIYYTLTGDDPTEFDIPIASGMSVVVDRSATLKARAFKTGSPPSRVAAGTYALVVTTPTVTPSGGTFTTPQTVSMSATPPDATIRYTTTGENPTEASPIYTGPINVPTTTTIRVAAFKTGWTASSVRIAGFAMNFGTLAAPAMSVGTGTYNGPVTVTLTSATPGAAIRYTTNGTTPQTYSPLYTERLAVDSTTTLNARAFHVDYTVSPSAVATFTMVVADPTFTPGAGTYLPGQPITVASVTPGATITYTLDDTTPVETGPVIASGAALTVGGYTLKARAWKTGYSPSTIATASYGVTEETITPLVAAGEEHSLAVRGDGVAWAWGANGSSRLGDGTTTARFLPVIVSGLTGVKALSGGRGHSLALQLDGRVTAWGAYVYGQLGDGTSTWRNLPVLVSGLTAVTAVAAGQDHSVAVRQDGTVWTWGLNNNGQLGDGTTTNRSTPVQVAPVSGIVAIAAGSDHTLALAGDGTVWAWGANGSNQLGDGTTTTRLQPVRVPGLTNVVAIGAAGARSLAVTSDGAAWQWGVVATGFRASPELIAGLSGVTQVAAGYWHSMALTGDGTVWCWGANASGQLGDGTLTDRASPAPALSVSNIVSIAAGSAHSLALAADGTVYSWGRNFSGQLGDGLTTNRSIPAAISGAAMHWTLAPPALSLSTGLYYASQTTIVTHTDPNAVLHYTANGADPTAADPVVASGGAVAVDRSLTLKVRASKPGSVTSPVASAAYELKVIQPTLAPSSGAYAGPQEVLASTTTPGASIRVTVDGTEPSAASAPAAGAITVSETGTLKARAWKDGWTPSDTAYASYWITAGTVATPTIASGPATTGTALVTLHCSTDDATLRYTRDGTDPTMTSPVYRYPFLVTGTSTIKVRAYRPGFTASAIASVSLALDDPNVVPTPTIRPAGGQFAAGAMVTAQSSGEATIRYTTDGRDPAETDPVLAGPVIVDRSLVLKVRAWQAGVPPSAVGRADFVITGALAAGRGHFLALGGDRRLWAWGDNSAGQIGNGTTALQLAPVVVLSDVVALAAAEDHSFAVKADGTVWAWGRNPYGQLGDGTQTTHYTPFQVMGLPPATAVATGARHTLALAADGTVWAWGTNQAGQLGDATTTARFIPASIPHLSGVVAIAAGDSFSLAIGSDGARGGVVWSWGLNAAGQLGDAAQANRLVPVRAVGVPPVTDLQAGGDWALALATDATVWSWGANTYGQLGDGSKALCAMPRRVEPLRGIRGIAAGRWHALVSDGRHGLLSWGNTGEHLGLPSEFYTSAAVPQAVRDVHVPFPAALAAGVSRSILARSDGSVWAFGSGPLGDGTTSASGSPVSASGLVVVDNAWLAADTDGDGLTTWEEWLLGTDPLDVDSNGNGVPDGVEPVEQGAGANADTDGDGVPDVLEHERGTDPYSPDSDQDGVGDALDAFPLDPSRSQGLVVDPTDLTPPVITLTSPGNVRRIR
jgi:alpha-tubulin suppressor-like RCC1 family protein